ncbi:MAG: RidA family protein [Opitutales bacterium]|nr:RidA family protein [Opitutales bacterium]
MKKQATSGSPFENSIGFCRATRIGNIVAVSGTAPINFDGSTAHVGDVYGQTKVCLDIIKEAIQRVDGRFTDIIRTRIFLKDISQWEKAAKAHGEYFSEIKPVCTFVEVSRFIDEDWLVEIEADCVVH